MSMPDVGTYNDVTAGKRAIMQKESGCVQLAVECCLTTGESITAYLNIILKDGSIATRTVEQLKKAVGWDGDFETLESGDWPAFQIVVGTEHYNGEDQLKVKWLNPNNATGGAGFESNVDAKKLKAQYGAKLRALAGGTPAPKTAPATPKPPTPRPAPKAPPAPAKTYQPSTIDACWEKFCEQYPGKDEAELVKLWDAAVKKHTGKVQSDCTPEDWGKMLSYIALPL